ncbi:MAG TPA: hypothetical protein PLP82_13345, partial [Deltaproteobacteria bacterium]|nr:hypothetical protein [Deltaproteobacteria bacterium]HON95197.1 hypothetical protein [Deltaproteobacteria bacterium]HPE46609.1 hypothetical protein [Deltaproteobacteria bacterium]HPH51177.1 hypothetical protein [Deltaproteobacteria bacterium]HPR04891.1 hypothetical protein [Deltaproteobacteria bacterium]
NIINLLQLALWKIPETPVRVDFLLALGIVVRKSTLTPFIPPLGQGIPARADTFCMGESWGI